MSILLVCQYKFRAGRIYKCLFEYPSQEMNPRLSYLESSVGVGFIPTRTRQ